jgi:hypothetical protein
MLKDPNSFGWKVLEGVAVIIDVLQWIIEVPPITPAGVAINEYIDPLLAIGLGVVYMIGGVSVIKKPSRAASLVASYLLEAVTASIGPAWIIDVLYVHSSVKKDWLAQQAAVMEAEEEEGGPLNRVRDGKPVRLPPRTAPLNNGGSRNPRGDIRPLPQTPTVGQTREDHETSLAA